MTVKVNAVAVLQKHQATGDEASPAPCLCPDLVAGLKVCSVISKVLKLVGKKAVGLCCCGSPSDIYEMLGVGDADWPHALDCGPCTRGWPSPCWCDQQQQQPLVAQCASTKSWCSVGIVCVGRLAARQGQHVSEAKLLT